MVSQLQMLLGGKQKKPIYISNRKVNPASGSHPQFIRLCLVDQPFEIQAAEATVAV